MILLLGRLQKEKRMFIIILIYWLANPSIIFLKSNIFTYKNIFAANAKKSLIFFVHNSEGNLYWWNKLNFAWQPGWLP